VPFRDVLSNEGDGAGMSAMRNPSSSPSAMMNGRMLLNICRGRDLDLSFEFTVTRWILMLVFPRADVRPDTLSDLFDPPTRCAVWLAKHQAATTVIRDCGR
jgi:hypothetical protein